MARPRAIVPRLGLHKSSGQAVVYIDRKPVYCGKYGSPEARKRYGEILARIERGEAAKAERSTIPRPQISIGELLLRFAAEKLPTYSEGERGCLTSVIRVVASLFAETPADQFGPLRLKSSWSRS